MSRKQKDTLDLHIGHRLNFDALIRFVKGEGAIAGLRPNPIKCSERSKHRDALKLTYGNECYWCGVKLTSKQYTPQEGTLDHVIPRYFGGVNNRFNLVLACRKCNEERDNNPTQKEVFRFYGVTLQQIKKYL